jgi:hypothetical protein
MNQRRFFSALSALCLFAGPSAHAQVVDVGAGLSVYGACPGEVDIQAMGLTPEGEFALIRSAGPGEGIVPGGPCAGLMHHLDPRTLRLQGIFRADPWGIGSLRPTVSEAACGAHVQVLDLETCFLSTVGVVGGPPPEEDLCWLPVGEVMIPGENLIPAAPMLCDEMGGATLGSIPGMPTGDLLPGGDVYETGGDLSDGLKAKIEDAAVHKGTYNKDTHDCDDFADELEKALDKEGETVATFTLLWRWDALAEVWTDAHAITDVHEGDKTVWIEPQTGKRVELDRDGDGKVNTQDRATGKGEMEGDLWVEVYDDRAHAERVFGPLD